MKAGYSALVGAPVALAVGVAKSVISLICPATHGADIIKLRVAFDGITATDKEVLVELVAFTADGTGTAGVVNQTYGRTIAPGFTTKYNYSVEPTVPTILDRWALTPIGGTALYDLPLGATPDIGPSTLVALRLTAPTSVVNYNGGIWVERC